MGLWMFLYKKPNVNPRVNAAELEMDGIYAVFMTEDGTLHYTEGAEGFLD